MGDGTAFPSAGADASPVFVDHLSDAGTILGTINMPTAAFAGSGNHPFTLPAASTSVGHMTLSTNGQYLTLGGDDAIPGTATVRQTTAGRVIGRITLSDGSVDTTTSLTDAYPGSTGNNNDIRNVVSTDGTKFWTSGTSFPTTGANQFNSGIHYATLGATTSFRVSGAPACPATQLCNTRVDNIFNGQLYTSSGSANWLGINTVGSGVPEPTANDQSTSARFIDTSVSGSGTASPYDFWFKDANTVYVADDRGARSGATLLGGGIQKWTFDGSAWSLAYILALPTDTDGMRGLDGRINANGDAVLYGTTATTGNNALNANSIVTITDTGAASTYSTVAASGANKIYRGIVFVPAPVGLAGDYNHDGKVDAADYVTWRNNPGANGGDPAGYNTWRANFGLPGAGLGAGAGAVPEPTGVAMLVIGMLITGYRQRRCG